MTSNTQVPTDFKEFVEMYRPKVYGKICEYLPSGPPEPYHKIVRAYVDRKGQYRRPSYVLLWTLLYGGNIDDAILPAAIQQASEDWILMLDDWMDGNKLRRGQPAAYVMYNPRYVLNASSHLHAINWLMAFDASKNLGKDRGERYFAKFYDIIRVTHEGQYLDMALTDNRDVTKFSLDDYYASIHAKAAYYTVYGPMQQGAIIAGANDGIINKLPEYGIPAGQAFQIKDDILDCVSTKEVLGKSIGNDVRDGCKNIILWHSVQNGSTGTVERLKKIYAKDRSAKTEDEIAFVLKTFVDVGSIDYAQKESERLVGVALERFEALTKDIPEGAVKNLARSSIGHTAKRSK
ncbi:MAG: polyprenyl synthetase family protein [Candidatus Marsarchaeota archaeon]|nr:polyprenyl synthetase family protein [Candidatus Marsarchaeota archaeon]